jgi:hypothetical protein
LSTAALFEETTATVAGRVGGRVLMRFAIRFRMVCVFPVPGGPSTTEVMWTQRPFDRLSLAEVAGERKDRGSRHARIGDRFRVKVSTERAVRMHERQLRVRVAQGIVLGQRGGDVAPIGEHPSCAWCGRRVAQDTNVLGGIRPIVIPFLRVVEDPAPGAEDQHLGGGSPYTSTDLYALTCIKRESNRVAQDGGSPPPIVIGLLLPEVLYVDGIGIRSIRLDIGGLVLERPAIVGAHQYSLASRIDHRTSFPPCADASHSSTS